MRHFEIMRLARTRILNVDEMYDAGSTIAQVIDPISDRCRDLTGKFQDGGVGHECLRIATASRSLQAAES